MSVTFEIQELITLDRMPEDLVAGFAGGLLHWPGPGPTEYQATLTHAEDFRINEPPTARVIRLLSESEYVDRFFATGELLLSSFRYFRSIEDPERGDKDEGWFLLIGQNSQVTGFASVGGGYDHRVLCCTYGEPDEELLEKFGKHGVVIEDPLLFAEEIAKSFASDTWRARHWQAQCAYARDKVVVGTVPESFRFDSIGPHLLDLAPYAKYFVKHDRFCAQSEYRFLWQTEHDSDGTLVIHCPEAVKYCSRFKPI